jgi:ABC-type transport system substrate-binding protein
MERAATNRTILSRRNFLCLSGLAATGLAAACSGGDAPPAATPTASQPTAAAQPTPAPRPTLAVGGGQPTPAAQPAATPKAYKEAPPLAALVREGKLPPVEQRLPRNPVAVTPVEKVGKHGGAWRAGLLGGADTSWLNRTIGYEGLVRWDPQWTQVIPNIAESFTASPDAKEYTFKLREGHRWSDGQPFSADDILFWYEDVSLNKELTPSRGNNPPTVEKIDGYTVKFKFERPDGFFLQNLARGGGAYTAFPAHYLKQFHKRHNTTNLDQLIQENGADGWVRLFQTKGASIPGTPYDAVWQNKDLPTLNAWYLTTPYGAGNRVVAERNPYYFKVDPEGNQLPYLDRVVYDVAQDAQVLVLKALNGELDMQDRHIATTQNRAVFVDNAQRGGYRFFETIPDSSNEAGIYLNWTHKDPVMRRIIQDKDFRIGLSHAIDRQEIIDVVYVGQGEPYQVASRPGAVRQAVHRVRRAEGERVPRQGAAPEGRPGLPPPARRPTPHLDHRGRLGEYGPDRRAEADREPLEEGRRRDADEGRGSLAAVDAQERQRARRDGLDRRRRALRGAEPLALLPTVRRLALRRRLGLLVPEAGQPAGDPGGAARAGQAADGALRPDQGHRR